MPLKILLVNPPPKEVIESYDMPDYAHLGLGYLGSYLGSKGISCKIIDAKLQRLSMEQVLSNLAGSSVDVVGITAMTHEVEQAGMLAKEVKKKHPRIIVVIGGVHATALPEETL